MQSTKQVGEYLVAAELCRRGWSATTFTGNMPAFDIVGVNPDGRVALVQVKTIRGGSWQFDARHFLHIDVVGGKQTVRGRVEPPNPAIICVFVTLTDSGGAEYYLFKLRDLYDYVAQQYKGGFRPKRPDSTHFAVRPKDIAQYKDKWELFSAFGGSSLPPSSLL